jgi:hypothetical protein
MDTLGTQRSGALAIALGIIRGGIMTTSTKGKSELAVTVARNAGALIEELTEQGQDQAGMRKMFARQNDRGRLVLAAPRYDR